MLVISILLASLVMLTSCTSPSPVMVDTEGFLQEGNELPKTKLQPKQSSELEDNRIGIHAHCFWNPEGQGIFPNGILDAGYILEQGWKRARLAIKSMDSPDPDILVDIATDEPEFSIDPNHDEFITSLAKNGVTITYVLSFWDAEYVAQGGEVQYPRFKTEGERHLTYEAIRELAEVIKKPPYGLTTELVWQAYEQLEQSKVKKARVQKLLTDIISLIRFAIGEDAVLEPFPETVNHRFVDWLVQQKKVGRNFTPEQMEWLQMIKEHIGTSVKVNLADFELTPFQEKGGAIRANKVFEQQLDKLLEELNGVLVA